MVTLAERKVSTLLLFGEGDPGVKVLEKHFGPGGLGLAELTGTVVSVVGGLDHDLTANAMRRLAADHMIDFLRHHPSGHDRQTAVEAMRANAAQQHSKLPAIPPPRAHNIFADLTQSLAS